MEIRYLETMGEFQEFISGTDKINCVKFGAEWCGPCKALDMTLEAVSEVPDGARFAFADVEVMTDAAESLGIMNVPSICMFRGGEELDRIVGLCTWPQIRDRIDSLK